MFFGGYLADRKNDLTEGTRRHLLYLLGALLFYYGILIVIQFGYGGKFQAIIHIITFLVVYLILVISKSRFIIEKVMSINIVNFIVSLIGGLTLEIYLMQYTVYSNSYIQTLFFPANIILFWIIVVILSKILSWTSGFIRNAFEGGK